VANTFEKKNRAIVVSGRAAPRGRFPHIRIAGDYLFVSGTSARRPDNTIDGAEIDGSGRVDLDIRQQTTAVLDNIKAILESAGASLTDIVEITTFLVSMRDFEIYNSVYGEYFSLDGPARTTVAVSELPHPHLLIEIKAIVYCPQAVVKMSGEIK